MSPTLGPRNSHVGILHVVIIFITGKSAELTGAFRWKTGDSNALAWEISQTHSDVTSYQRVWWSVNSHLQATVTFCYSIFVVFGLLCFTCPSCRMAPGTDPETLSQIVMHAAYIVRATISIAIWCLTLMKQAFVIKQHRLFV